MNLYNAIKQTYPTIQDNEFTLVDNSDGQGPFIASWTFQGAAQPELSSLTENTQLSTATAVRPIRDQLLSDSDYRMLADYVGTDQELWKIYRQALRALPDSDLSSGNVTWPQAPV